MSAPLPGQRAGQHPLRAAVASQRAIGRAVSASGGYAEVLLVVLDGQVMRITEDADGNQQVTPYEQDPTDTTDQGTE